jgi:hypothetical protein
MCDSRSFLVIFTSSVPVTCENLYHGIARLDNAIHSRDCPEQAFLTSSQRPVCYQLKRRRELTPFLARNHEVQRRYGRTSENAGYEYEARIV